MTQEPTRTVYADGSQEWYVNGQLHRLDGPARVGAEGTQEWWVNGKRHRLAGPAYIGANGTQEWWVNGQWHRLDGPASIRAAGTQEWWVNYQNITTHVEAWMQTQAVTWPWDDQTQMQFILTFG
jgi:hypothetical protein